MGLFSRGNRQNWSSPESIGGVKGAVAEDMKPLAQARTREAKEAAAAATEQPRHRPS